MLNLNPVFKGNKVSIGLVVFFLSVSLYYLICFEKGTFVLLLNENRTSVFDFLFRWVFTKMGEPIFCVVLCVVTLFLNKRKGALVSIALIINTVIVQVLKNFVFSDHKRPLHYFEDQLNLIKGLDVHSGLSFPSGHTIGGFTLYFMLSLFVKSRPLKITLMFLGLLVGLSRVYLSQHFLEDVVASVAIATVTCVFYFIIFNKTKFRFE